MQDRELLNKFFKNVDDLIQAIYKNGGIEPIGCSSISWGYGGGVNIDQFHQILTARGIYHGLCIGNPTMADQFAEAINNELLRKYPDEINSTNLPFQFKK